MTREEVNDWRWSRGPNKGGVNDDNKDNNDNNVNNSHYGNYNSNNNMVKRHPIGLSRSKLDFARRGLSNG